MLPKSTTKKRFIPQLKIADMFSMGGIGLVGLGLGASMHEHFVGVIPILILVGAILHGMGMYGKFQIEREQVDPPLWVLITFGMCWMLLMMTAIYILIGRYVIAI